MFLYRIADCRYINDLSGKGAAIYGGRWNSPDTYIVYSAESPSLALLEAIVRIGKMPELNYCMIVIEIPDSEISVLDVNQLTLDWYKNPPPDNLKTIGDKFIQANQSLALIVPSVIMPEEHNCLLNPGHKDFGKVKIKSRRTLAIDERIFKLTGH